MINNNNPAIDRLQEELFGEELPEGYGLDDQGPEPRNDNDEDSWEDDEFARIHADDMERDDTPFLTEDDCWNDNLYDTGE